MKKFCTLFMVVGFILIIIGSMLVLDPKTFDTPKVAGNLCVIFGNTLFGSGFISLAITQAVGRKT